VVMFPKRYNRTCTRPLIPGKRLTPAPGILSKRMRREASRGLSRTGWQEAVVGG
jgi:hypothetical protein